MGSNSDMIQRNRLRNKALNEGFLPSLRDVGDVADDRNWLRLNWGFAVIGSSPSIFFMSNKVGVLEYVTEFLNAN